MNDLKKMLLFSFLFAVGSANTYATSVEDCEEKYKSCKDGCTNAYCKSSCKVQKKVCLKNICATQYNKCNIKCGEGKDSDLETCMGACKTTKKSCLKKVDKD